MTTRRLSFLLCFLVFTSTAVRAQSLEVGVQVVGSHWSEFKGADSGFGARIGWRPIPLLGLEAELNWYPGEFPDTTVPFSDRRIETVLAVTAGPRVNRFRPFVRAGAGMLRTTRASKVFACIAIFPPPLACLLAGGDTLPSFEVGGGLEFTPTGATFLRLDAGDRIVKYPGPTLTGGTRQDEGFLGHAFRFSFGGGWRF